MVGEERAPDQRILKGAPATLSVDLPDANGELDDTVVSGVTVTVTRLSGTALATGQAATTTALGVATYDLSAAQTGAGCDWLTAAWTHNGTVRATSVHEVVGRHWFPPSALREIPGVEKAMGSGVGDATTQTLIDARTWVEALIEWATAAAWVPRAQLDELDAGGRDEVVLSRIWPRTLRAVSIDDVAQTLSDFAVTPHGTLRRASGGTITAGTSLGLSVLYDHGADAPPADLVRAAIVAAGDWVTSRITTLGNRLTGTSGNFGTISYASVDPEHPTGIPSVDATIRTHSKRTPGVG